MVRCLALGSRCSRLTAGAINAITAEFATAGIGKAHTNPIEQYQYRSIDDILNRFAPLLSKHRLCVLPRVLEREVVERVDKDQELLIDVTLRVAFSLVSAEDGSSHLIEAYGEALDGGDKGTAKAMSAAYKFAMIQAFCIPVSNIEDADATTHRLAVKGMRLSPCRAGSNGRATSKTSLLCARASKRSTSSKIAIASS